MKEARTEAYFLQWVSGSLGITFSLRGIKIMAYSWNSSLEIGIEEIDNQHQVFIGLINELQAAHDGGNDSWALSDVIPRLADYAKYHFDIEEYLFDAIATGSATDEHHLFELRKQAEIDLLNELETVSETENDAADLAVPLFASEKEKDFFNTKSLENAVTAGNANAEHFLNGHRAFSDMLRRITAEHNDDDNQVVASLLAYIEHWLVDHLNSDKQLFQRIRAQSG